MCASSRVAQRGEERPAAVDHSPHVDVDDPVQVVERLVLEVAGGGDTRVVHQDVAAAVLLQDLGSDGLEPFRVTHVGDVHGGTTPQRPDRPSGVVGSLLVRVEHRHVRAARGERLAGRPADAAAGSGDHGHPVTK